MIDQPDAPNRVPVRGVRRPRRRRWLHILLATMLLAGITAAIPASRTACLQALGRALVVDEPRNAADVIVLSVDAGTAGVLEAADLVHSGVSSAVAVLAEPPTRAEIELLRRGVWYEDAAARSIRHLAALGIATVVRIPGTVTGTGEEPDVLVGWFDEHGYRSAIVVTTTDHSRRARRVFDRAMKDRPIRVFVRPSRYSSFQPDTWWHSRSGIRTGIIELQKLLLDCVRHPLS